MDLNRLAVRIARSENLPVFSDSASTVIKMADDPTAGPRDLEKIIERDPAITAKILRAANSSYYGAANVPNVGRAIAFLGMNATRSLVVSIVFQQMVNSRGGSSRFDAKEYWRHSLAVGVGARIIGRMKFPVKAEELYCAGMMHDIGYLVMDRYMDTQLDVAIEAAQASKQPIHLIEEENLGYTHAAVGALLADKWNLTRMIRSAVEYHHKPEQDEEFFESTAVISMADTLAHQAGFTNHAIGVNREIDPAVMDAVGIPEVQFEAIRDVMVKEVMKAQESLSIAA